MRHFKVLMLAVFTVYGTTEVINKKVVAMHDLDFITKTAQENPQFEQSFSDLAYSVLKGKTPKLLSHMVGFQVVDKDEDDTRALGIFGFKLDKQWLYAPVFFLNGELKGQELLYIKDRDTFVPLQENWVNYLVNRKPPVLGEPGVHSEAELSAMAPDFRVFTRSPLRNSFNKLSAATYDHTKAGEVHGIWHSGELFDLRPAMRCIQIVPTDVPFKKAAERMDLREVVKRVGDSAAEWISQQCSKSSAFSAAISTFYSRDELTKRSGAPVVALFSDDTIRKEAGVSHGEFNWWLEHSVRNDEFPGARIGKLLKSAQITTVDDIRRLLPQLACGVPTPIEKKADLPVSGARFITMDELQDMADLTDGERGELMTNGYTVRDEREDDMVPELAIGDGEEAVSIPDSSGGLYSVLSCQQASRKVLVLPEPYDIGRGVRGTVVVDCESRSWEECDINAIPALEKADQSSWQQFYDGLAGTDSIESEQSYVIVCPDGRGTVPFFVTSRAGDDLAVHTPCGPRTVMLDDKSTAVHGIGNMLIVPRSHRVMAVKRCPGLDTPLASHADVTLTLSKAGSVQTIRVWSDGARYQLEDGGADRLTKFSALRSLIEDYRLRETSAVELLKQADRRGFCRGLIKSAQPPSPILQGGPVSPSTASLDNISNYDPQLGVPVSGHESQSETVLPYTSTNNEELYDPFHSDYSPVTMATQLANSGEKDVFDTTVLSNMMKSMTVDETVDGYLKDLVVGEDRLGRMLFMFYWHNEEFSDRYGTEDMQELEDSLRNAFKINGDLILFLKKQDIDPEMTNVGSDVDLSEVSM